MGRGSGRRILTQDQVGSPTPTPHTLEGTAQGGVCGRWGFSRALCSDGGPGRSRQRGGRPKLTPTQGHHWVRGPCVWRLAQEGCLPAPALLGGAPREVPSDGCGPLPGAGKGQESPGTRGAGRRKEQLEFRSREGGGAESLDSSWDTGQGSGWGWGWLDVAPPPSSRWSCSSDRQS